MSEIPWGRPAVSRDSRLSPTARGVDQLSQLTLAYVLGFTVDQLYRAPHARARCTTGSTCCRGGLGTGSECPWGRPSVPRLGPVPRSRGVNQVSRATRIQVRGPAVSTSSSGRIVLRSDIPRGGPAFHCHLGPCPMAFGVDQPSGVTWYCARGPAVWNSLPRRLALGSEGPRG